MHQDSSRDEVMRSVPGVLCQLSARLMTCSIVIYTELAYDTPSREASVSGVYADISLVCNAAAYRLS